MIKKGLNLGNSIYSRSNFDGLSVSGGRLVNNRPDGQTGISQASDLRKSMKMSEKISIIAKGTAMGEMMSEMSEDSKDCGCS
jgi:hypothetical protein